MFTILQVDPKSLIGDEQLGSKSKFWFTHAGQAWLFKQARDRTGEDWAEKVAAEIAKLIQVSAAEVELAQYLGRRGSASLSFMATDESLMHGNEILAGQLLGYNRQKKLRQSDHTFDHIVSAIQKLIEGDSWYHVIVQDLARYLVLDALICNTDRHHENWGFLSTIGRTESGAFSLELRIAPSFDHASSLGRELLDTRASEILAADGVAAYARRGHGGIYWTSKDRRGANPLQLVELSAQRFPDHFGDALADVAAIEPERLMAVVDQVPDEVMSDPSRRFAKALLAYTHGVLAGLAT